MSELHAGDDPEAGGPPSPQKEAPASGNEAGAEIAFDHAGKPEGTRANVGKSKAISCLTDLPPVRDFLSRIKAVPRGMTTAVVKISHGKYWRDLATIRLDKASGEVKVRVPDGNIAAYEPTEVEAAAIKAACANAQWPEPMPVFVRVNCPDGLPIHLPPKLHGVEGKNLFAFHDAEGRVVMLQHRASAEEVADGAPKYAPWSYWDDEAWRNCEPDSQLPLWGTRHLKDAATVFLHEGAMAARAMARMVAAETREDQEQLAAHPWGRELSGAVHLGWIGGALSPHRTDFSALTRAGVKRVYTVSDNDEPGREAVPGIAQRIFAPTFAVTFNDAFPASFDLGDPFPEAMFKDGRYSGPAFMDLVEPATWATEKIELGDKSVVRLRKHFVNEWVYADKPELFISTSDPRIIRNANNLTRKLHKFSDSPNTANMLLSACEQVSAPAYRPFPMGKPQRRVTSLGRACYNVFQPSNIRPVGGDVGPWREFITYLCPNADERKELERWAATLIARPEVRMHYGLLLVSERQGVGKGIFATEVLAPLVGEHNVSYPSDNDVTDNQFNDWMAHRRLVVVGEIYQGQSWKAYNRLKGVITDRDFTVNQKHQQPYQIENWCHVVACSNSLRCLKMDGSDRRWFYPEVTEEPWPREKFEQFVAWLGGGGLSAIAHWAGDYGDYVKIGERPPDTLRKRQLVEESLAEELRWAAEYCAGRIADSGVFAISTDIALDFVRQTGGKAIYSTKREFGAAMAKAGMWRVTSGEGGEFFVKFLNKEHRVFLSPEAREQFNRLCQRAADFDRKAWLRERLAETSRELGQAHM